MDSLCFDLVEETVALCVYIYEHGRLFSAAGEQAINTVTVYLFYQRRLKQLLGRLSGADKQRSGLFDS